MPHFCARFRTENIGKTAKKTNKAMSAVKIQNYLVDAEDYHAALDQVAPMRNYLEDTTGSIWLFDQLFPVNANETPTLAPLPDLGPQYRGLYYHSKYAYQLMIVEGTRLLDIPSDKQGRALSYGAWVKNLDTGEMTYACPNGEFFTHQQVQAKRQKYFPDSAFVWHPIFFPLVGTDTVDFAFYITSRYMLTFPTQFWGHASYDEQINWIMTQEGFA